MIIRARRRGERNREGRNRYDGEREACRLILRNQRSLDGKLLAFADPQLVQREWLSLSLEFG